MLIQAHRGNSGHAPENTLSAFRTSLGCADGIECDIHLTSDGHFVVCHDASINRTSNGTGNIAEMTLAQLKQYDFGNWYSTAYMGEYIPTLEEMLDVVRHMRVINIEIKHFVKGVIVNPYAALAAILHKFGVAERVIISSFDTSALKEMIQADTMIYTALLCEPVPIGNIDTAVSLGCRAVHPMYTTLTPDYVEKAHTVGLAVNAWTANTRESILRCRDLGCDAVITNEPALADEILSSI